MNAGRDKRSYFSCMLKAGISKYSDCLNCDENGDFSIQHSLSQVPKILIVTDMSDM